MEGNRKEIGFAGKIKGYLQAAIRFVVENPKVVIVVFLVIVIAAGGGAAWKMYRSRSMDNKTTRLGFENIGELATQAAFYSEVSMLENSRKIGNWDIPFTQSKYIFTYDGVLKAGIDFEGVEVKVDEKKKVVTITLPEGKILSNILNEDSLKVFDESQSIFTPLHIGDVSAAQAELKADAEANAIANGLLEQAEENAKALIQGMLSSVYDPEVYTFEFVRADK